MSHSPTRRQHVRVVRAAHIEHPTMPQPKHPRTHKAVNAAGVGVKHLLVATGAGLPSILAFESFRHQWEIAFHAVTTVL